jgi:hypothetical protein
MAAPHSATNEAARQNTVTLRSDAMAPSRKDTEKMPMFSRLAWYELIVPL